MYSENKIKKSLDKYGLISCAGNCEYSADLNFDIVNIMSVLAHLRDHLLF